MKAWNLTLSKALISDSTVIYQKEDPPVQAALF
jgi:hypothetical protein